MHKFFLRKSINREVKGINFTTNFNKYVNCDSCLLVRYQKMTLLFLVNFNKFDFSFLYLSILCKKCLERGFSLERKVHCTLKKSVFIQTRLFLRDWNPRKYFWLTQRERWIKSESDLKNDSVRESESNEPIQ